jgi:ribosomal protein S18 acetylase RimI-like enzyme
MAHDAVDLREISAADLDPLLEEEIQSWEGSLHWDFRKSAALVRKFVDLRALNGYALVARHGIRGYAYYILEDHKALIGDLYVSRSQSSGDAEQQLLGCVLKAALSSPYVRRIEAQLMMMISHPSPALPGARHLREFERNFMLVEDLDCARLRPSKAAGVTHIERWTEAFQEPAAQVIAAAYHNHIDAQINDQYRSPGGARKFLYNIVQYPGCGAFSKPASFAAFEPASARLSGICLSSIVGQASGHITQICVTPAAQGTGVGYELLRHSLEALAAAGCRETSLTVTASNREAVSLYERVGFRTVRKFPAFAWEGF